jgi:hypothetical protein
MTFDPGEAIEMERRHIREGEARVARQEAIVRRLESGGSPEVAQGARELLASFREFLASAQKRVDDLERRYFPGPPKAN